MLKLIKRLLAVVLIVLIAVVAGGYWFLSTFDLNKYKTQIAEAVEKEIGRKLVIAGDARLGISFIPTLIVNDISLSNAPWAANPEMVKLGRVEVKVSLLPLLKKQIAINTIALDKPEIYLEVNKAGEANWVFPKKNSAGEVVIAESAGEQAVRENPSLALLAGLTAENVVISDGVVVYDDAKAGKKNVVDIHEFAVRVPSPDARIGVHVDVAVDGQAVKAKLAASPLKVIAAGEPLELDLDAQAYGASAKVSGSVSGYMTGAIGYDLAVKADNPKGNFGAPEVKFDGQVAGDLKKVSVLINSLAAAGNIITGSVSADISGARPFVDADLSSELVDLTKFAADGGKQAAAFEIIGTANASEMVPATPVPFELLNSADAKLALKIARLVVNPDVAADNVALTASLTNGVLNISPLSLGFGGGSVALNSVIDGNAKSISLKATANGMQIQKLSKDLDSGKTGAFGFEKGGALDLDINLRTSGGTYRALEEHLDGRAVAIVGESVVRTGKTKWLDYPLVSQVLSVLKLGQKNMNTVDLTCSVVRADFAGGKMSLPQGFAIQSKQLNFVANGSVNLVDDRLDLSVQPSFPNAADGNISGALSSFVKISGTASAPAIALDNQQALKAVVGLATNAPNFVGTQLLSNAVEAPCYSALAGTAYESRFPKPTGTKASGQEGLKNTVKAAQDFAKGIVGNAKGEADSAKASAKQLEDSVKGLMGAFGKKKQ